MSKKISAFILIVMVMFSIQLVYARELTLKNPGFEDGIGTEINGWSKSVYRLESGITEFKTDGAAAREGSRSLMIRNLQENDARVKQEVEVADGKYYRISCYTKTENVGNDRKGANISIDGLFATSPDIKGSSGWEYIELYGKSGKGQKSFVLTLGIGGYGSMNQGTAWFDAIKIEELDALPEGVSAVSLYNDTAAKGSSKVMDDMIMTLNKYVYTSVLIILLIFALVFYKLYYKNIKTKQKNSKIAYCIILLTGLIIRLLLGALIEGHGTDMNCFKAWASIVSKDFLSIYNGEVFMDYPPGIVYILYFPGLIVRLLNMYSIPWAYNLIIKLPAICADILAANFIYKVSKTKLSSRMALFAVAAYLFNPAVLINSAVWGQVDSILVLLVVTALYLLYRDKLEYSAAVFAIAVLVKPQGIIFFPVLLFELIRKGSMKRFFKAAAAGLATAVIIILPFAAGKEPFWIFNLYMNTASGYKGATVNAFNFFGLFGANWRQDSSQFLVFSYFAWGMAFIVLITLFSLFIHVRSKNSPNPFITAAILVIGVFTFSSRMHERYMFPAVALLLMAYILLKDTRLFYMFALASITSFINTWDVFALSLKDVFWVPADSVILKVVAIANILLFMYLVKVTLEINVRREGS